MGNSLKPTYYDYNKFESGDKKFGPNYTGPLLHPSIKDFEKESIEKFKTISTIEPIIKKMEEIPDNECLGYRKILPDGSFEKKYTYFKYKEVYQMMFNCSKNLHLKLNDLCHFETYEGIDLKLIGIFAKNCVEWTIADLACQLDSITTVTLYATLGQESYEHICNQTLIKTVFLSPDLIDMFCDFKQKLNITNIQNVILFDMTVSNNEEHSNKLKQFGVNVFSFKNDFLKQNNDVKKEDLTLSKPDTVMTICYTSGTTSKPKGAMILQKNLICSFIGSVIGSDIPVNRAKHVYHYSYLPLAHIFERMCIAAFLFYGGKIGYISGSVRTTMLEDMGLVEPLMLVVVPKVIQTIKMKIFDNVKKMPPTVQKIFYKAFEIKKKNYEKYGVVKHAVFDKIIFGKIQRMFGRNFENLLCASAPLPKDLATDIKVLLSTRIVEGFGMTELGGSTLESHFSENLNISQGGLAKYMQGKLIDIEELSYTKDTVKEGVLTPSGEFCVRGPSVFLGYYKNPEETAKTIDKDGFLHTGDVASVLLDYGNAFKIIDRVKEIFKLSQGEYIIPAKLEAIYSKSKYVEQIVIYGNSYKNNIIALINPNWNNCAEFLGLDKSADVNEMSKSKELYQEVKRDLLELATQANFNSLEKVNYFLLLVKKFSIENGCLNPSMKIVRKKVETVFKDEIEELYKTI